MTRKLLCNIDKDKRQAIKPFQIDVASQKGESNTGHINSKRKTPFCSGKGRFRKYSTYMISK